jgi:hypothetical protein
MNIANGPLAHAAPIPARSVLLSRLLSWLCLLAALGFVGISAHFARSLWFWPGLSQWTRFAFVIGWIVCSVFIVWGLYCGRVSFKGLVHGELFTRRTIAGLRNLALGIFLFKITSFLLLAGLQAASRYPEVVNITFRGFSEGTFTLIGLGAIVVITSVLTRAAEIAEDNAQII